MFEFKSVKFSGTEEEKANQSYVLDLKSGVKTIRSQWHNDTQSEHDLIYIINLNGPITKNGGESTYGTKDLAANIKMFEANPKVKGGIILGDSGGGSTVAVEIFRSTLHERKKPIVTLIEKGSDYIRIMRLSDRRKFDLRR